MFNTAEKQAIEVLDKSIDNADRHKLRELERYFQLWVDSVRWKLDGEEKTEPHRLPMP